MLPLGVMSIGSFGAPFNCPNCGAAYEVVRIEARRRSRKLTAR
jgi:predicted RNA-binding Zn-ribbon protein involved in translation (DUF1610 family)